MSQAAGGLSSDPRGRMGQGNRDSAVQRAGDAAVARQQVAQWNNSERQHLLADAYIGAPLRLSRQPDLCLPHRWNTHVNDLTKLVYGQKTQVELETARFLNASPQYLVCNAT